MTPRATLAPLLLGALLAAGAPALGEGGEEAGDPAAPGTDEALPEDAATLSIEELHDLCSALDADDEAARRTAAARILGAAPSSVEAIRRRLLRDLRSAPGDIQGLLDHLRREEPAVRFPPRREEPFDTMDALLAASRPDDPNARRTVAETTEVATLLRALAETGSTAAAAVIVRYGPRERGVFRVVVGRELLRLGDRAVPALMRASRHPNEEVAAFAAEALEWLGLSEPGRQVQVRDPAVLTEVLSLFGEMTTREAIPVLLSFSGSENAEVRQAARGSLQRFGRAALWPTREKYENFTGSEADRSWGWEELAERLFEAQDRARLAQAEEQMTRGLALAEEGRFDEMYEVYRQVLGRWPRYDRRAEMAPGLVAFADRQAAAGRRRAARALLIEAALLTDTPETACRLRARVSLMDSEDALDRGVADLEPLDRALEALPEESRAADLRQAILSRTAARDPASYRAVAAIGLALFGLACLGLLVVRLTPRAPPPTSPQQPPPEGRAPDTDDPSPTSGDCDAEPPGAPRA